jgi:hypothetical protein
MLIGLAIYFAYGIRHSRLRRGDPIPTGTYPVPDGPVDQAPLEGKQ